MESYMRDLGLVMNLSELGVTQEMLPGISEATFFMNGGYKALTREEVLKILQESI